MSRLTSVFITLLICGMSIQSPVQSQPSQACEEYYVFLDSLREAALPFFKDEILDKALKSDSVPEKNKVFLQALLNYLSMEWTEQVSTPMIDAPIQPVFEIDKGTAGITSTPKYDCYKDERGSSKCEEITFEHDLVHKSQNFPEFFERGYLAKFPEVFIEHVGRQEFYLITKSGQSTTEIVNFCSYEGDCLEYYMYEINPAPWVPALFASRYEMELVFEEEPLIEETLEKQYKNCFDCRYQYEPVIAFARLKGVPNLYFAYVDAFDQGAQYEYPQRSLHILLPNGRVTTLWAEVVDLFGCACL